MGLSPSHRKEKKTERERKRETAAERELVGEREGRREMKKQ